MMRSLFSGVSGLKSHQTRMDVIGNNIANVNTTGFKSSRTTFADTLSQTLTGASSPQENLGGTNPKQIGLGVGVASVDLLFTDGSVQSTGKNTDLCLSGNGLFVVKQGSQTYYTRDGAFAFDADGNYVLPSSGLYVQGWMAKDGVLASNGAITNITIPSGKSMAAKATEKVTYTGNINAAAPTILSMTQVDNTVTPAQTTTTSTAKASYTAEAKKPVTIKMSDGNSVTQTSGTYTVGYSNPVTTTVKFYDELGNAHNVPLYFTKTATSSTAGNTWTVSVLPDISKNSTTITEADGSTTTVTMASTALQFSTEGKLLSGSSSPSLTLTNGAGPWTSAGSTSGTGTGTGTGGTGTGTGLGSSTGVDVSTISFDTLTQYSGSSTVNGTADGNAAGTLSSVSVDSSGIITGTYTNGVRQKEAQVAVAQFTNASGLTKTGNSLYQESNNSGTANVKTASDLGCTITPSALEMSNVDVANEFSDMIITQRGFQSNSKIITVGDEMLETLINMKR
ncbi:flagellar hook protein FlgE [uncultured Selenomonas sp.]|uniref:flagellar hook protein FlgE n=1 Tax=uncultured Selenomonas sp. TaxID=159275 RepID=UPI0025E5A88E|nr:flagellar hook protein FlgE [uncultured Selenomonas sp.]